MKQDCAEQCTKALLALIVMFIPAEGEKTGEEREKDKEKREDIPTATEVTDAKEKSDLADVKKGASDCLW